MTNKTDAMRSLEDGAHAIEDMRRRFPRLQLDVTLTRGGMQIDATRYITPGNGGIELRGSALVTWKQLEAPNAGNVLTRVIQATCIALRNAVPEDTHPFAKPASVGETPATEDE